MTVRAVADALAARTEATVRETDGSFVVLTPDRVWKVRKHERRASDDDRSTLAGRYSACRDEVQANAAQAPQIYLGVRALVEHDGGIALGPDGEYAAAVEYAVEMVAFEPQWTLAAMLGDGRARTTELEAAGGAVAAFHTGVREAHGDLRADHVLLTTPVRLVGRPPVRQHRCVDVAHDMATLMGDVERHGSASAADTLLDAYARAGGPVASRAQIRDLAPCTKLL